MKRILQLITLWALLLGTVPAVAQEVPAPSPYLEVTLTEAGTLAEKVGDRLPSTRYLVVSGPMNEADFATIRGAYEESDAMEVIDLSNTVFENNTLPDGAFHSVGGNLCKVVLPEGVETLGKNAFRSCKATNINIPSTVTSLGTGVFYVSDISGTVTIPIGVTEIPNGAFCQTRNLYQIYMGKDVKVIGDHAFRESNVSRIWLPSVRKIGEYAFHRVLVDKYRYGSQPGGITLNSINFNALGEIGEYALAYSNLSGFYDGEEPSVLTMIPPYMCAFNQGVFAVRIPANVTTVCEEAYWSTYIETIEFFGDRIDRIESGAFDSPTVKSIKFPAEIGYMSGNAFGYLKYLESIEMPGLIPPVIPANTFQTANPDARVYIPVGTKAAYEAAEGWNYFTNFIEKDFGTSGVEETVVAGEGEVKVYVSGGRLRIDGAAPGTRYTAYTLDGRMVSGGTADAPASLPTGAYIVKVADRGYKVVI